MTKLRLIREKSGMTQKALAEAAGISGPFLFDLEMGNRNAKPDTWERIAKALGCKVDEIREKEG